ncbi:4001_t:CDS:2 [Paraglomus occultum]|uniref:4001_t:CDS:1 n=1 Tax=Paraglomus occultum TaxID=144539 RepID=A0A9N9BGM7_9GLOM|nr:4001_t:CDS:2 [Paraglomus occultum]
MSESIADYYTFPYKIQKVCVIGAGVAGLVTAKVLMDIGLNVTVYERGEQPGGIWVYSEDTGPVPLFPSTDPMISDPPEEIPDTESSCSSTSHNIRNVSPIYAGLHTNIPTPMMTYFNTPYPPNTPLFPNHKVVLSYLKSFVKEHKLNDVISYNVNVTRVIESENGWKVITKKLKRTGNEQIQNDKQKIDLVENNVEMEKIGEDREPVPDYNRKDIGAHDSDAAKYVAEWREEQFDAVVVCTGHYNVPYIPEIDGLKEWANTWPERILHSKQYRRPDLFEDQPTLVIGCAASGSDISRELASTFKSPIYLSVRRIISITSIAESVIVKPIVKRLIVSYSDNANAYNDDSYCVHEKKSVPYGQVEFIDGTVINVHRIIFATGFMYSYPFLHGIEIGKHGDVSKERILVTSGKRVYNLYKQVFYIPNPTLAFVALPLKISPPALSQTQALLISHVYASRIQLPFLTSMRKEYNSTSIDAMFTTPRDYHEFGAVKASQYIREILELVNSCKDEEAGEKKEILVFENWREDLHLAARELRAKELGY